MDKLPPYVTRSLGQILVKYKNLSLSRCHRNTSTTTTIIIIITIIRHFKKYLYIKLSFYDV